MIPLTRLQHRSLYGRSKRNRNAVAHLQALERRAYALMHETATVRAAMSGDAPARFNDPRYERGTAVNATDVRASRQWLNSRHSASDVTVIRGLPLWLTAALTTDDIVRLYPSHVTVVEAAETASKPSRRPRKSKTAGRAALRAARLREAAGTIRMGEQD